MGDGSTSWDAVLPYGRVVVAGDSMSPTLLDGDQLLCRRVRPGMGVREGDVVVLERPDRPGPGPGQARRAPDPARLVGRGRQRRGQRRLAAFGRCRRASCRVRGLAASTSLADAC